MGVQERDKNVLASEAYTSADMLSLWDPRFVIFSAARSNLTRSSIPLAYGKSKP